MKRQASANLKKVLLVEDHSVFTEGLVGILEFEQGLAVCGQSRSAEQALRDIPGLKPDIFLVDISLTGLGGLNFIKRIRAQHPKIKLLVISTRREQHYAARVLLAGGDGYVTKQQDPEEIVYAVRDVLAGRTYISEDVMVGDSRVCREGQPQTKGRPSDRLSDLEKEIIGFLIAGKSKPEIASLLGLDSKGLASHYARMRKKLR
jgi:DNA-binding NarL/FixJ family response regulator